MSKTTNDTKKLTNAGSVATLMASVAFAAALGGILLEPIGYFVHLEMFGKDVGLFSGKAWYSFFTGYDKHIIIFLLSIGAMFICFEGRKRRRIGSDAGALITLVSFGLLLASLTSAASSSDGGTMEYTWATLLIPMLDTDMIEFDQVLAVLYYVLPIAASGLMMILGLFLWMRADVSSFWVECPRNDKLLSSSTPAEPPARSEIEEAIEAAKEPEPAPVIPDGEEPPPEPDEDSLRGFETVLETPAEEQPEEAVIREEKKPAPEPEPEADAPEDTEEVKPVIEPEKPAPQGSQRQNGGRKKPQHNRSNRNRGKNGGKSHK